MKSLLIVLTLCLCSGCAATRDPQPNDKPTTVHSSPPSRKKTAKVRTDETVKAYPVGRYTDPNYPNEMHERHTVYRREQAPDWNYLPDEPYSLPMGPTVATSKPSPSYYVKTDNELMNAQQRAYAESLREQNRALKTRIESLQQDAEKVPELKEEIENLQRQLDVMPEPPPIAPVEPDSPSEPWDDFSLTKPLPPGEEPLPSI